MLDGGFYKCGSMHLRRLNKKINYCHDGCCENSLISDFIVVINMDCIICTVTDGYNVWVPVGLSLCVYVCLYVRVRAYLSVCLSSPS